MLVGEARLARVVQNVYLCLRTTGMALTTAKYHTRPSEAYPARLQRVSLTIIITPGAGR